MVEKKLRFWYERDEKKRKRTPKISTKVTTLKVLRVKLESRNHQKEPTKKKSLPRLVDEHVIPPTDMIQQGVNLLNVPLEDYLKQSAAAKAQGSNVEKEAETTAKNVEAEGVKETFVEGVVLSDSSATESDEVDPTKIAPTSYVSGKEKFKGTLKKKKDSDEEDSTYVPTPNEKKKARRKRKARPTGVVLRSVRARKDSTSEQETTTVGEVQSVKAPEVEAIKVPESEKVQSVEVEKNVEKVDDEVEYTGERKSTPPASPINPIIHIHDDPKKSPEVQPKKLEDLSSAKKATTSSSSHRFPKVVGEYPEDLPEDDYDLFNEGKINVFTKKVSVLKKQRQRQKLKQSMKS
ncbi:hypothetical protein Hanom_Chr13g01208101 [Helianthus anomalus]